MAHKDSSIESIMVLLRLDDHLAERLGMAKLQPDVGQLTISKRVAGRGLIAGDIPLSAALDNARKKAIGAKGTSSAREPIAGDVFSSLGRPFSAEYLFGPDAFPWDDPHTSSAAPASTTSKPTLSIDDYDLSVY